MPEPLPAETETSKDKPRRVGGKLKAALDLMIWGDRDSDNPRPAMPYDEAARTAGLTVRSMRRALERHHAQSYLRKQRQVLRASLDARTLSRLAELRDQ